MKEKPAIFILKSRQTGGTLYAHQEWLLKEIDKLYPPFLFKITKKDLIEKINIHYN